MDFLYHIFTSFKTIRFFAYAQTSSELAQRTLQKWGEPTTALMHLLKKKKQTLLTLEAACIIWGKIATDNIDEHIQILNDILQHLPEEARDHALHLAADENTARIASLLINLAPFHLEGFSSLAATIKQEWDRQNCNDDLALAFYEAIIAYGVPPCEAAESQVRVLLAKASYARAEAVLLSLFAENPTPPADLYWSFLDLEQQVKRTPEQQISALQYFIEYYPADQRVGPAWQKIGDLYGSVLLDDRKALDAYFKAEQCGLVIPQLQAYRVGNWDAIPALHHHWGKIVTDNIDECIQILKDHLQRLPEEARDNALRFVANKNTARIASLLINLAPFHLEGFSSLAATIKQEWDQQKCNDDLALAFYEAIIAYGIPPYEAAESQVRVLLAKASYARAEAVLSKLFAENPTPPADLYWSFLDLEQQVKRTPEQQISALQYFIEHYPADHRVGPAWQKIGDLYGIDVWTKFVQT
jgi:hypothetical protein